MTIRPCDSDEEIATFQNNTWSSGGTLLFPDGRQYPANTNFWQTQYQFTTEAGDTLIHYRNRGILGSSAEVTISAERTRAAGVAVDGDAGLVSGPHDAARFGGHHGSRNVEPFAPENAAKCEATERKTGGHRP